MCRWAGSKSSKALGVLLLWAGAAIIALAQSPGTGVAGMVTSSTPPPLFTTLFNFDFNNGAYPYAGLIQGVDGNLYGTTFGGGCGQGNEGEGCGVVFKANTSGTLTALYFFCSQGGDECTDGLLPQNGLVQGTDGNFYGMTSNGGAGYDNDQGTVFKMTPSGQLTTLHSFCSDYENGMCLDGAKPFGSLVEGVDGNFYGTTGAGGNTIEDAGTVFRITPSGQLTTLYNFCTVAKDEQCLDGMGPEAGLVLGTDGKFYGTTRDGGVNTNGGTVFSITSGGVLTTLYSLPDTCIDGCSPLAPLIEGRDGNFYGTTSMGGPLPGGSGTVFKIMRSGQLTTLYSFCQDEIGLECLDGSEPMAPVMEGTDGNFYGTTAYGGIDDQGGCGVRCGTAFQLTPQGQLTVLHDFCSETNCDDGFQPQVGLMQDTDGSLYGMAFGGGDYGTIFRLDMELGPFVETNPVAARVGKKVGILGTNLSGATNVTFNGVAAEFKVRSPTLIVAEVPSGATSGKVQVQLPGSTLTSNVPFIVLPLH